MSATPGGLQLIAPHSNGTSTKTLFVWPLGKIDLIIPPDLAQMFWLTCTTSSTRITVWPATRGLPGVTEFVTPPGDTHCNPRATWLSISVHVGGLWSAKAGRTTIEHAIAIHVTKTADTLSCFLNVHIPP